MDGVRKAEGGGEGATGEIAWVPFGVGRSADGLHRRTGAPMAVCGSCDARDGERIRSRELSRTGLARVCGDLRLSGGWVADGCVERAQRTHTEEFYEVNDFSLEMAPLNRELLAWERIYNTVRPHQALGYLTPHQFVTRWLSHKKEVMCHPSTGRVHGVYFVPILVIRYGSFADCPFGSNPRGRKISQEGS